MRPQRRPAPVVVRTIDHMAEPWHLAGKHDAVFGAPHDRHVQLGRATVEIMIIN